MRVLGVILIVAGVLAMIYGGISYTKEKTGLDVGPIEAKVDDQESVPIPPISGGVAVIAGVFMVLADRRSASV